MSTPIMQWAQFDWQSIWLCFLLKHYTKLSVFCLVEKYYINFLKRYHLSDIFLPAFWECVILNLFSLFYGTKYIWTLNVGSKQDHNRLTGNEDGIFFSTWTIPLRWMGIFTEMFPCMLLTGLKAKTICNSIWWYLLITAVTKTFEAIAIWWFNGIKSIIQLIVHIILVCITNPPKQTHIWSPERILINWNAVKVYMCHPLSMSVCEQDPFTVLKTLSAETSYC